MDDGGAPRPPAGRLPRFDRMVSLGGNCEVAYQLRCFSGSDRAYPFDWWVLPLGGLPALLDAGADAAFALGHLSRVDEYDGVPALYSRLGGTVHMHEFRHDEAGLDQPLEAISAALQEKYAALDRRLRADCAQGHTLFVRNHLPGTDPGTPEALAPVLEALHARLSRLSPGYRLLLVGHPPVPAHPALLQAPAPRLPGHRGLGSRLGWTLMLWRLGVRAARRGEADHSDLAATFAPVAGRFQALCRLLRRRPPG
ncbi:DUF1796 family putative cysteine peptidase [Xanthobacter sp. V0B-10]|uniref:DUF1796 family putative cysteine peptidase n=1 Tax=Xanthobacter albus TaxID=3119929 RepID=UPI0037273C54